MKQPINEKIDEVIKNHYTETKKLLFDNLKEWMAYDCTDVQRLLLSMIPAIYTEDDNSELLKTNISHKIVNIVNIAFNAGKYYQRKEYEAGTKDDFKNYSRTHLDNGVC